MKTLNELQTLILEWADQKDLLHSKNAESQCLKFIEEAGELAKAIFKNDIEEQKNRIGDCFIILVILAKQIDRDLDFNFSPTKYTDISWFFKNIFEELFDDYFNSSIDYLNDLALHLKLDLTECANIAYNKIKP